MKLQIHKKFFSWTITDETGAVVSKIKRKNLFSPSKIILDRNGNLIYTTDIVNCPAEYKTWNYAGCKKYVIYRNEKPIAVANLHFAINPDRTVIQKLLFRPPQVDRMDIKTIYGTWVVKRQKNNGVTITHNETQLGKVTPFFSLKPSFLECNKKYDITFWAGIYILTDYMMHEDDLIVI